jgi:hypothetical protein
MSINIRTAAWRLVVVAAVSVGVLAASAPVSASASTPEVSAAIAAPTATPIAVPLDNLGAHLSGVQVEVAGPSKYAPTASPSASIGLGWYVYLRFSPAEQRFILTGGVGTVVVLVCAATAGVGCVVAGLAGVWIAAWISEFYNPRCWVEVKLTYSGSPVGGNRCWKVA